MNTDTLSMELGFLDYQLNDDDVAATIDNSIKSLPNDDYLNQLVKVDVIDAAQEESSAAFMASFLVDEDTSKLKPSLITRLHRHHVSEAKRNAFRMEVKRNGNAAVSTLLKFIPNFDLTKTGYNADRKAFIKKTMTTINELEATNVL